MMPRLRSTRTPFKCVDSETVPFPFPCECFDDVYRILGKFWTDLGILSFWVCIQRAAARRALYVVYSGFARKDFSFAHKVSTVSVVKYDDARMFLFSSLQSFDAIFIHRKVYHHQNNTFIVKLVLVKPKTPPS